MNLNSALDKEYEDKSLKELLDAPIEAFQGVSPRQAELLKEAFNIKTIGQMANLRFFKWARAIAILAEKEE